MNEAERCDRISLMQAGNVLAIGVPRELVAARGKAGGDLHRLPRRRDGECGSLLRSPRSLRPLLQTL
jgi:hypothetical protein